MKNLLKWQEITADLLDFSNQQNHYELIGTDLSTQTNITNPQQINFIGKLEENIAWMLSISAKQKRAI